MATSFSNSIRSTPITELTETLWSADVLKLKWGTTSTTGEKKLNGAYVLVSSLVTGTPQLWLPPEGSTREGFTLTIIMASSANKSLLVKDDSGSNGVAILDAGEVGQFHCVKGKWYYGSPPPAADGYADYT